MWSTLPLIALVVAGVACAGAEVHAGGKVANENEAPLGGVKLIWRLAAADAAGIHIYTDPSGNYAVRLPSADDYLVDVERIGHFPLRDRLVSLREGDNEIDFTLNRVREVFSSVEVTAAPPPIDMDTTSTPETVTGAQIVNVPYPSTNNLRNALRIIPGVVQDSRGRLHINGGNENQALYTLDGFNITDPLTGRFETRLSVEAVQSVDIASGRLSAEYGKGSAGVLAIHTKTGDDRFRYSATNFIPGVEYRKELMLGNWTPRVNLSGPIRRGRAWFSNNADTQYVNSVVKELPAGEDRTSSWRFSNHLNTQVNLTPSNILYTGFLATAWTAPRFGLTILDPRETTVDRRSRQWFFHVKDQIYLPREILLEIGYAANRTFGREIPQGQDLYLIMPEGKRGNFYVDATRKSARDQVLANAFLPSFNLAGEHRVKVGTDLNRLSYWQDARRTGFENYGQGFVRRRRTTFGGSGLAGVANYEASLYLQDSWRFRPNLLFEAGIRGDWDQLVGLWSLSPRFGFAWSPPGLERTKISGGYATVHDATSLRLFARPRDQYSLTTYFHQDGTVNRGPAVTVFTITNTGLARPRYRNYSAGVDQQWDAGIHTHFEYLRKRGHHGFTYVNSIAGGETAAPEWIARFGVSEFDAIYTLTNNRRDVYDAFRVTVRQAIRRQYEWMMSYTRSRALSNAVVDISIDDPLLVDLNVGPMPWDSPNRLLSWGYLPTFRKKWAVAYLLEWRTGFPFSALSDEGHVVGKVNSYRFPSFFVLNLHLERRFGFRNHLLALRMGCNNITNRSNPNGVNNNMSSPNFMRFYGGQDRSINFRIRWLGKS